MLIILAPDSFKGSMSSRQASVAMHAGIKKIFPKARCLSFPMADGGEGTLDALIAATDGKYHYKKVKGPDKVSVRAKYGISGDGKTAIIEMAQASGLTLLEKRSRNPMMTTTYGTGELILAAANKGVKKIILGIGGSATNDAGAGMAQALGIKFYNGKGKVINTPLTGGALGDITNIDCATVTPLLNDVSISVACDVSNLLCGQTGASYIYGPQKGATSLMAKQLDKNLNYFGDLIKKTLGINVLTLEGGGAAGGLGAGLVAFTGASLEKGIDIVIKASGIENSIKKADLVITGEGSVDKQTVFGKVAIGIAQVASKYNVPVITIGGRLSDEANIVFNYGIDGIEGCIAREMTTDEAVNNSAKFLKQATERSLRLIHVGRKIEAKRNK